MSEIPPPTDAELETQRATAALVRSIEAPAPVSLHRAIRELADGAPRARRAWSGRPLLIGALASGAALIAVLLVLLLSSGGEGAAPTVGQASTLALRPPTLSAPGESQEKPGHLGISAAGIAFPYWGQRFGWQAVGARSDSLGGRTVTTVFYVASGHSPGGQAGFYGGRSAPSVGRSAPSAGRIAYSIVAGPALAIPTAGRSTVWSGVRFQVFRTGASTVVTWRRAGHTCILVGSGVGSHTLLTLANT